jgi:hypothetical protein
MRNKPFVFCLIVLAHAGFLFADTEVHVEVDIGPRIVLPAQPVVVFASPGIYVVPDYPFEVFLVSGFYWSLHSGYWYRCAGPGKTWVKFETGKVPPGLVKIPPGKYKNWHPAKKGGFKQAGPGKGKGKFK